MTRRDDRHVYAACIEDLDRLADFLIESDIQAASATRDLIHEAVTLLARHPLLGRRAGERYRELVISRGKTGYVAAYEYDPAEDRVIVHAIRHQREAGFDE